MQKTREPQYWLEADNRKTYEELELDNARLRGRLSERRNYINWMVAFNAAMLVANVYMFGTMLAFISA